MEESRGAEGEEHHGQNSTAEVTTNTVYTILQQRQPPNPYRNSLYSCYYCDNFETNIKQDYESRVVNTDAGGKLCFPSKADLAKFRLEIQPKIKDWKNVNYLQLFYKILL